VARRLFERVGLDPASAKFELWAVPTLELVESQLLEAHEVGRTEGVWSYADWIARGAPAEELKQLWAMITIGKKEESPEDWYRIVDLAYLYAAGHSVDPLIAAPMRLNLSNGSRGLLILDGRHRLLAAALATIREFHVYIQTQ
jgi:hypothetical protein